MPVEYAIDHEKQTVVVRAHGAVVLDEVLSYFDALVVQDAMRYPKLFDARDVTTARLSDDDIMTLGARVSAYEAFEPRGPIAAVAATPEAVDVLRRFMNLGGAKRPMKLFASLEQAEEWLAQQP